MYIMSYVIGNNLVVFIMIDKFIGAICNENRARLNVLTLRSSSAIMLAPINLSIKDAVSIYI